MEITSELKKKAMACETVEELMALASENDIELSEEEARLTLQDLSEMQEGELADEELNNVAGGAEGCQPPNVYEVVYFKTEEEVQFIFNVGDQVEALAFGCNHHTATCKVVNRTIDKAYFAGSRSAGQKFAGYVDKYWLEKCPGVSSAFASGWYGRNMIEK